MTNGYAGTTVKDVVTLAGVSRSVFYEQFKDKQDCFLATFDLIAAKTVARVRAACHAPDGGDLCKRTTAAFVALTQEIDANTNAAYLVLVEAQVAGVPGLVRLRKTMRIYERLLADDFARSPEASPLPPPIVRGIVGGIHETVARRLRGRCAGELPALSTELVRWTLLFRATPRALLAERASLLSKHAGLAHSTPGQADLAQKSPPQLFDALSWEILQMVADPSLVTPEWPSAVRHVIRDLMRLLASKPLYAQTIAMTAAGAGPEMLARSSELAYSVATLLTKGAPTKSPSEVAVEGISGAIWHTIGWQVATDSIDLLPVLADYLAYIVLASFLGPAAAAAIVTKD